MGAYNILFMMAKGELPAAEKNQLLATYFTGIFRAMRFGAAEAHGKGAAMQSGYLPAKGAFTWDVPTPRYRTADAKLAPGLPDPTRSEPSKERACTAMSTPGAH